MALHDSSSGADTRPKVWMLSLPLLLVGLALLLPGLDTAAQELAASFFQDGVIFVLVMAVLLGSGVIQLGLGRLTRFRRAVWVLPWISAVLMLLGELFWQSGGWGGRIGGIMLVTFGFPIMLGSGIAVLIPFLFARGRLVRMTAAAIAAGLILLGVIFWPSPLNSRVELSAPSRMLYFEPDGEFGWLQARDPAELMQQLKRVRVTPCLSQPVWNEVRGVLLPLSDGWMLVARYDGSSWICEYAGEPEKFDGGIARWKIFGYSALYGLLRTSSMWVEE